MRAGIRLQAKSTSCCVETASLLGGVVTEDYASEEIAGEGQVHTVRLSELFGDSKTSLFVYSFMYGSRMESPCSMFSSFPDALNASARRNHPPGDAGPWS